MEDLPLGRIAASVPEFAVKDLPLGITHDDDDVLIFNLTSSVSQISSCVTKILPASHKFSPNQYIRLVRNSVTILFRVLVFR